MGRGLIKLNDGKKDWYLEWSTVSDAPGTWGMSLAELKRWTKEELGNEGLRELPERLKRCDKTGTSFQLYSCDNDVYSVINFNRAGRDETCLTAEQIVEAYCRRRGRWSKRCPVKGHTHSEDDAVATCDGKGNWR